MEKLFLFLSVSVVCQFASCEYSSSSSYDERINELERKVETLTERMDLLTNPVDDPTDSKRCVKYDDIPANPPEDFPKVLPLEARRELTTDGELKISLEYWTPPSSVVSATWRDGETFNELEPAISNSLEPLPVGVSHTELVVPVGNTTGVLLWISSDLNMLQLQFNTSASTLVEQTCIPLPVFQKEPVGDIVYVPGHDTTVQFEISSLIDPDENLIHDNYFENFHADPFVVDTRTGEQMIASHDDGFVSYSSAENSTNYRQIIVGLNTSSFPVTGFVRFRVSYGNRRGDLVTNVKRVINTIIRPDNQAGPFPDGFLTFMKYPHNQYASNGTEINTCDISGDNRCEIGCSVLGTDITDLGVYKVLNSGEMSRMTTDIVESVSFDTIRGMQLQIDEGPDGSVGQYQCVATNGQGVIKRHDINVYYYRGARIDPDTSGFIRIKESLVELTCAVVGRRGVHIKFRLNYGEETEDPDTVVFTHGHMVARKLAVLPADSFLHSAEFYGHSCQLMQVLPNGELFMDSYLYAVDLTENEARRGLISQRDTLLRRTF